MDQNSENVVFINNPRTAWLNAILIFFLDKLLQDTYIIFQKVVVILNRAQNMLIFS